MQQTIEPTVSLHRIEETIAQAIEKVHAKRETDICRYIPTLAGVYMHHFTLRKLKHKHPDQLVLLIEKFILNAENPGVAPPKPRAARGLNKRKRMTFTQEQIEKMRHLARTTGDKEIFNLLLPRQSLRSCKRKLIASIQHGLVEKALWDDYVAAMNSRPIIEKMWI